MKHFRQHLLARSSSLKMMFQFSQSFRIFWFFQSRLMCVCMYYVYCSNSVHENIVYMIMLLKVVNKRSILIDSKQILGKERCVLFFTKVLLLSYLKCWYIISKAEVSRLMIKKLVPREWKELVTVSWLII